MLVQEEVAPGVVQLWLLPVQDLGNSLTSFYVLFQNHSNILAKNNLKVLLNILSTHYLVILKVN